MDINFDMNPGLLNITPKTVAKTRNPFADFGEDTIEPENKLPAFNFDFFGASNNTLMKPAEQFF